MCFVSVSLMTAGVLLLAVYVLKKAHDNDGKPPGVA